MNPDKIGNFIKILRKEKGWTQEELAEKIPISREAISKWERGKRVPEISALNRISEIFAVSINEILSGEKNPKEDITLKLYKENNRSRKYFKLSLIGFIFMILLFLAYYFFNQYQSTIIYTVSGLGNNFNVKNGLFINTRDRLYFNLNGIEEKNENIKIEKISLMYKNSNNEEVLITSTEDKYLQLIEDRGYEELFPLNELDNIISSMYLRVYYNNEYEDIKLNLYKDYINNKLFFNKSQNINNDNNTLPESKKINIDTINAIKEKYIKTDDGYKYKKTIDNKNITILNVDEYILLSMTKDTEEEKWLYDLETNLIKYTYTKNDNLVEEFDIKNNNLKCIKDKCQIDESAGKLSEKFFECLNDSLK